MTAFFRIIKFALKNFWRNLALSIVTVTILVLVLFSTSFLLLLNILARTATGAVENKIDVSVFFEERVAEEKVLAAKNEWEKSEPAYQLSRALIKKRLVHKISQVGLAKKANTTQAVISRLENMSVNPSLELLQRIARALNVGLKIQFE